MGEDGLAADDVRFFTVEVKPAWPVLVVAPKPTQQRALFLTEALAPALLRKRGRARFDCQEIDFEQLPRQALDEYAAVFLLDPPPLEPAVWQKLADYAAGGHGVAIFLGRNARPVDSFNVPAAQQLLPGKLLRQARRPDGKLCLAPHEFEHPVLTAFRRQATAIPWDDFPVFRYWELEPPPPGVGVLLPYIDGRPALLERSLGNGHVLCMTTPVSDSPSARAVEPPARRRGLALRDPGQRNGVLPGRRQPGAIELLRRADRRVAHRRAEPAAGIRAQRRAT